MNLKIVHRQTGLTLRNYLKEFELRPVNWKPGPLHSFKEVTARYVLSENGLPGFYYHAYDGVVLCWLDGREFEVRGVASVDMDPVGSEDAARKEIARAQDPNQPVDPDARPERR